MLFFIHSIRILKQAFILFEIISDLKQMKEEIEKENTFLTELLNMEEAPHYQTNKVMCPMLFFCKHLSLVVNK